MNSPKNHQSSISSLRLLHVLECLASSRTPMRLQDIAIRANMSKPTILRYLYALQESNYIYQEEETSRYALTWSVCKLSENLDSLLGLRNIANPFINRLSNMLSLGSCLVVEKDFECVYLDCIDNPNSSTLQRIGRRAPLHATGSGKMILTQFTDQELSEYIIKRGLTRYTPATITNPDVLRAELDKIRTDGYAMDEGECEEGLRCISFPLRDYTGGIAASMSVFGRTIDMSDERVFNDILPVLREATETISSRLGYRA